MCGASRALLTLPGVTTVSDLGDVGSTPVATQAVVQRRGDDVQGRRQLQRQCQMNALKSLATGGTGRGQFHRSPQLPMRHISRHILRHGEHKERLFR